MSFDLFRHIVDELKPYRSQIEKFDLWGLGEPLLDKNLFEKIRYAKDSGLPSIAIATNADLLNGKTQDLLDSGIDVVIFSIDGARKDTHEGIRIDVNFDNVVENALCSIELRDRGGYDTRFVFRFIRQDANAEEWPDFRDFWSAQVSQHKGDVVSCYDVHSWGGEIAVPVRGGLVPDDAPCHHVFDRMIILWDGTVPLCCADMHHADYTLGNVRDESPVEVFNSPRMKEIRELHLGGRRKEMRICRDCTILQSEAAQQIAEV